MTLLRGDQVLDVISDIETEAESKDSMCNESVSDSDDIEGGEYDDSGNSEVSDCSSDGDSDVDTLGHGSTATFSLSTASSRVSWKVSGAAAFGQKSLDATQHMQHIDAPGMV